MPRVFAVVYADLTGKEREAHAKCAWDSRGVRPSPGAGIFKDAKNIAGLRCPEVNTVKMAAVKVQRAGSATTQKNKPCCARGRAHSGRSSHLSITTRRDPWRSKVYLLWVHANTRGRYFHSRLFGKRVEGTRGKKRL